MTFLIVLVATVVIGVVARPAIVRRLEKERLQLKAANERREADQAKALEAEAETKALIASQPDYFRSYGIEVVARMSAPRVADTGNLHLTHPVGWTSDSDDGPSHGTYRCRYECGEVIAMREVGAVKGPGVEWLYLGWYCPACGALGHAPYRQEPSLHGPLGRRLKDATNLFDALGPPKTQDAETSWRQLETEEASLEARLNAVRTRRLALAEKLGKPVDGGPFRPRLLAGGKDS